VTIKGSTCTVTPLGGAEDDSSAILYAFNELCHTDSTIELPGSYVVGKALNTTLSRVTVNLRCARRCRALPDAHGQDDLLTLAIDRLRTSRSGKIQYTPDIAYWSPNSIFLSYQVRHA
jgi:hypothetical protein